MSYFTTEPNVGLYVQSAPAKPHLVNGYRWLIVFDRSRSFKIIDFCINWKFIYDLLLVIVKLYLSSRFRVVAYIVQNQLPYQVGL